VWEQSQYNDGYHADLRGLVTRDAMIRISGIEYYPVVREELSEAENGATSP